MPIRSANPSPESFSNLNGLDSHIKADSSIKDDKTTILSSQGVMSSPGSKRVSILTNKNAQQDLLLNNVVRYVDVKGKTLITETVFGKERKEIEAALVRNELGIIEKTEDDGVVFKFIGQQTKKFESLGINSVEVRESSGAARVYTSFNFQTLSDKELDLLMTHVKAYIVFLKAQADPTDEKTEKSIERLELKLRYLEIEKAIRTNDPQLKELLEELVKTTPYVISMKLAEVWAQQDKAITKKKEEEAEQNIHDKQIIILKDTLRWNLQLDSTKEAAIKSDINSNNVHIDFINQEAVNKGLVNIGSFISIHRTLK